MADVVNCLEGDQAARAAASRDTPEFDVLAALQEQLDQARAAILSGTSLQDLLDQRDQRIQAQAMYFI
jgi:DNA-binding IscR family transcriptional regulator